MVKFNLLAAGSLDQQKLLEDITREWGCGAVWEAGVGWRGGGEVGDMCCLSALRVTIG